MIAWVATAAVYNALFSEEKPLRPVTDSIQVSSMTPSQIDTLTATERPRATKLVLRDERSLDINFFRASKSQ